MDVILIMADLIVGLVPKQPRAVVRVKKGKFETHGLLFPDDVNYVFDVDYVIFTRKVKDNKY